MKKYLKFKAKTTQLPDAEWQDVIFKVSDIIHVRKYNKSIDVYIETTVPTTHFTFHFDTAEQAGTVYLKIWEILTKEA